MNWDYLQPVKIHFGKGRVKEIKEIARKLGCFSKPGRCRGRCLCGSDPAEKYRICGSTGWRQSHGLCQSSCQCSSDSGFHP